MSVNEKMTALADEIRNLSGSNTAKGIDDMTTDVSTANTEITEQTDLISQIVTALEGKASGTGGTILPTLSNPATTSDILASKEAIDGSGNKITGTIETKTSTNLTASGATVTVPSGYYATNATKSVTTATQATPSVSINSSGLITASATQTAGYVFAGTKNGTKQLTTQATKTIIPSTSSQTAVAKNVYTTGTITVAPIPSNYEDVADETEAYTTKLASLETAITALETELEGKASGGSGGENTPATVALVGGSDGLITRLVYEDSAGNVCDYFDEFGYGDVEFPTTFTTTVGKWICLEYDNGFGELSTTGIEVINSDIAIGSGGNTIIILIKITEATATIQVSFK